MLRNSGRKIHPLTTPAHQSSNHSATPNSTSHAGPLISPALRRKRREGECMLQLERVLGLTTNKPMVLSVNETHDLVAYAAGCVVVLYNHNLDKQIGLLCSASLKKSPTGISSDSGGHSTAGATPSSSSSISSIGQGLRGISSLGGSPRAMASNQWMNNPLASPNINPLAGLVPMTMSDPSVTSSFGSSNPNSNKNIKPKQISCLSFSPDGQFLAIGEMGHQPRILIWDVALQTLAGELQGHKFGVQAVQFSPNSKYVVSLGFQHDGYIHVWNWRANLQIASNKVTTKVNALAFSKDGTYFVTAGLRHIKFWYLNVGLSKRRGPNASVQVLDGRSGILGELRDSNYVDAVCSEDGKFTYALTANGVLCLFSEGRVMEKWVNLHARGAYSLDLGDGFIVCACTDGIIRLFDQDSLQYIGTMPKPRQIGTFQGLTTDVANEVSAPNPIYADVLATQLAVSSGRLMCVYSDRSFVIWDISDHHNMRTVKSHIFHSDCVWGVEMMPISTDGGSTTVHPAGTFLTYSADGSIVFWNLDHSDTSRNSMLLSDVQIERQHTLPSNEIVRILYADEKCRSWIQPPDNQDGNEPGYSTVPQECGVRIVKISADGRLLASGDRGGNLRVHDLESFERVTYQEAHDTEILAIDFTDPTEHGSPFLVATAGRDRLLHVFDIANDYALLQTLDDHSSSITCIKFTADGSKMMSCGADKSVVFRSRQQHPDGLSYQPYHQAPGRATFYDMDLHQASDTITTVSGDRRFNIFALDTGKAVKSFKAETKGDDLAAGMAEICSMTHISLDPSGTIAAASGSDKSVRLYDLLHGTCLAHMICHSELVTGLKFTLTYDRIISTSADGCVLVWKLSHDIVRRIQGRTQEGVSLPSYLQAKSLETSLSLSQINLQNASPRPLRLKRSVDRLGAYASEQFGNSRRNSTASLVSEDYDDNSDDWGGKQVQQNASQRSNQQQDEQGLTAQNFLPVIVTKPVAQKTPGSRARPNGPSLSKSPLSRPRQTSLSQPATPRAPFGSRLGSHHDLPAWNQNVVKERVVSSSLAKVSRPPSPLLSPAHQQRVTKTVKSQWLASDAPITRPRASSMSVIPKGESSSSLSKLSRAVDASESQIQTDPDRQSLSDDAAKEHRESTPRHNAKENSAGRKQDDGDDMDTVIPVPMNGPLLRVAPDVARSFDKGPNKHGDTHSPTPLTRSYSAGELVRTAETAARDETEDEIDDPSLTENGSDDHDRDGDGDGDDEDMNDDEGGLTETESDLDNLMPLPHRGSKSGYHTPVGGGSVGKSPSFQEGELLSESPKRGHVNGQPNSRVASLKTGASDDATVRRSLSAKFLTAHASTVMMGLAGQTIPEDGAITVEKSVVDDLLIEVGHDSVTPKASFHHERPFHPPQSTGQESVAPLGGFQQDPAFSQGSEGMSQTLEVRPNSVSSNASGMRRKQRQISQSTRLRESSSDADLSTLHRISLFQHSEQYDGSNLEGPTKAVERTRKRLTAMGYLSGSVSGRGTTSVGMQENEGAHTRAHSSSAALPRDTGPAGILASPANLPRHEHLQSLDLSLVGSAPAATLMNTVPIPPSPMDQESLQGAFDRISFLIANKASLAWQTADRRGEGIAVGGGSDGLDQEKEVEKTTIWMKETRAGLLNLVGEVQGHLWALERAMGSLDQGTK